MEKNQQDELLKDRRIVEEINRHLWIESEKVGHDVGFETAARDWLDRFSKAWMQYHVPTKTNSSKKASLSKRAKK